MKHLSRELRKNSTLSEVLLWNELKARKMKGYQFMRQKPIGDYIVDFYCGKLRLIIEIDGESHSDKAERDRKRQEWLESIGLTVLRFYDIEIKRNLSPVIMVLERWIEDFEGQQPP
ncbi:MAG: endonuclease domain-containing protein [Thermodesulfovibrionales bacterium]